MSNKWDIKYYKKLEQDMGLQNLSQDEIIKILTKLYIDIVLVYEKNKDNLKNIESNLNNNNSILHYLSSNNEIEKIPINGNFFIKQKDSYKYVAKINENYFSNQKETEIWIAFNEIYYKQPEQQYIKKNITNYIDIDGIHELYIDKKNINHGKISTAKLHKISTPIKTNTNTGKRPDFKKRKSINTAIKYKDFRKLTGDKLLLYIHKEKNIFYMKYLYNGKRKDINKKLKKNLYKVGKHKSGFLKDYNGNRIKADYFKNNKNRFRQHNVYKIFHKDAPFGVELLEEERHVYFLKRDDRIYSNSIQTQFNREDFFINNKDIIIMSYDIELFFLNSHNIYYIESDSNCKKYFSKTTKKIYNFFDENEIKEETNNFGYLYYKQNIFSSGNILLNNIQVLDNTIEEILENSNLMKIFQKETNCFTFMLEDEKERKNILVELLYKLRNSISHQDFKIIKENNNVIIQFQNEHSTKNATNIKLLANIFINDLSYINNFVLKELNLIDKKT